MAETSAYTILGITKDSDEKDVKNAYINLVKKYDPEKHTERFMVIQRAYDRLRNPKTRASEDIHTFNVIRGEYLFNEEEKASGTVPDEIEVTKMRVNYLENSTDAEIKRQFIKLLFQRADYAIQRKQLNDAIRDFGEIHEIDPANVRARQNLEISCVHLGYSYALHGLHDEAVELWERALQLNPDNPDLLHNLALAAEKAADGKRAGRYWAETVNRWKGRLDKDSTNDYLRNCIVEALNHHGEYIEAGRMEARDKLRASAMPSASTAPPRAMDSRSSGTANPTTQAPRGPSSNSRASNIVQKISFDQQVPEAEPQVPASGRASARFREIARLNPDDFDAHYQLCNKLMEEQQWEEALEELRPLQRKHQKNVEVLNLMGWAMLSSGKVDDAFLHWKKSMAIDPKNASTRQQLVRAHLMLGKSFRSKGIFTKALVHFKQLLQLMPNSAEVHLEIAATYDMKGDLRNAVASYEEVMKLDPKNKVAKKAISDLKLRR